MLPAFSGPIAVINNARKHINDLDTRLRDFFAAKPYTRFINHDIILGQDVYTVRLTRDFPIEISTTAKDAFSNLRDALDHAVYASAVSIHHDRRIAKTNFPFAPDAAGVHRKLNKEFIGVPPEIRTLLEGFCPHETGNRLLWALNDTRNTKTHRMLVPMIAVSVVTRIKLTATIDGNAEIGYSRWSAAKNEVEYMRLPHGTHANHDLNVSADVLFGDEAGLLRGEKAIPTLNALMREVESVTSAIEAETARIMRIS